MNRVASILLLAFIAAALASRRPERSRPSCQGHAAAPRLLPFLRDESAARMAFGCWDDDRTWPSKELH